MSMNSSTRPALRGLGFVAALALAPLVGCGAEPIEDIEERAFIRYYHQDCSNWRCGYNTTEINGKSLQELHLGGQANVDGVKLVGFLPPVGLLLGWKLEVDGDELVARGGVFGKSTLRGHQLLGSVLLVRLEQGLIVPVVIAGYQEVDSWAEGGDPLAAYSLVYADLHTPLLKRSICKGTLLDPLQASVVVLANERYDLESKTVIEDQDGWITLACAGSAAAKMALLGYGPKADFEGTGAPASVEQRQATLKMITADYCGDGTSYTADGTLLAWENQGGSVVFGDVFDSAGLEAFWTADGALCLDQPRLVDPGDVACSLPSCDDLTLDDGEWASYL